MPVATQYKAFYQELMSQLILSLMLGIRSGGRIVCLALSLLVLVALSAPTEAAMVKGLYSQEVPITGQSYKERSDAMSRALAGVLVKVAGQREVLSNPVVQSALAKPETYIRKFGFRTDEASLNRQQIFQATFDEQAVNRLLRSANVAIWGQSRPSTLVWLAMENAGRRSIVNASETLPGVFAESFQERGLPVLFPLMDFEDSAAIAAVDVWGGFSDKIQDASRRYGSESILAGRLSRSLPQDNELFYGRLSLIFRGVSQSVAVNGLDAVGVTRLAADLAGSTLSRHYAIDVSDASGKALLVVENVSSLEDYAGLYKYLERMTAVREVSVHKVRGSTLTLDLTIDGSVSQLVDALALGRNLQAVTTGESMVYRWFRS
ncbi:DUF2066 domain-containing protein [Endozoicomonas sp.]|uniref:DUF2066 domain-containing protein n=1 Tax=Endozoicomonas sp. TaxID=1892382 RepID=UPI0028885362|nr:DUF2066 domain-containing protein [Endozoicomonas sp.]